MTGSNKILVIDDDKYIQRSLEKVLQRAGYEVITAGTAAKGLQSLRESKPNLLILDIQLPDMSGVGVLNEFCGPGGQPSIPILVLTGRPNMEQFFKGFSRVGVIQKPYTTADLLETIHRALAGDATSVASPKPVTVPESNFKTMIVEGDDGVVASLQLTLKQAGFPVIPFQRGLGVLEQIVTAQPDVLLVNRILPGINGDTVAAALARSPEAQRMVVVMYDLSAMARSAASLKERCPNIVAYLTGIDSGTIVDAVRKAGATVRS